MSEQPLPESHTLGVRRAVPRDAARLARMVAALFEHSVASAIDPFTPAHIPKNLIEVAKWFRALCRDDSALVLVIESGGQPVGFLKGHRQAPYAVPSRIEQVGYISMVWVEPEFRRQGAARLLVEEAEAAFHEQGVGQMERPQLFTRFRCD